MADLEKPNWSEELRRHEDDRYDALERRVRKLEKRGQFLESASDERLYLWLFGAYVFFGFIVPTLRDFLGEKKTNT